MSFGGAKRRLLGREFSRTDSKARVLVPVRMRDELGGQITMTTGLLGELRCYRDDSFVAYADYVLTQCEDGDDRDRLSQHILSPAMTGLEFDPSGRLTVRDQFQRETDIGKNTDVAIVWRFEGWMEIWNRTSYDSYRRDPAGYMADQTKIYKGIRMPNGPAALAQPRTSSAGE